MRCAVALSGVKHHSQRTSKSTSIRPMGLGWRPQSRLPRSSFSILRLKTESESGSCWPAHVGTYASDGLPSSRGIRTRGELTRIGSWRPRGAKPGKFSGQSAGPNRVRISKAAACWYQGISPPCCTNLSALLNHCQTASDGSSVCESRKASNAAKQCARCIRSASQPALADHGS